MAVELGGGDLEPGGAGVSEAAAQGVEAGGMSFKVKTQDIKTEAVPMEPEGLSTAQRAVPVPWWWGCRKVTARWICPAMGQIAVEVKGQGGKK